MAILQPFSKNFLSDNEDKKTGRELGTVRPASQPGITIRFLTKAWFEIDHNYV